MKKHPQIMGASPRYQKRYLTHPYNIAQKKGDNNEIKNSRY